MLRPGVDGHIQAHLKSGKKFPRNLPASVSPWGAGSWEVSATSTKALPGARWCSVGWLCGEAVLPASLASSVDRVRVRGGAGVGTEPWPAWTARAEPGFQVGASV